MMISPVLISFVTFVLTYCRLILLSSLILLCIQFVVISNFCVDLFSFFHYFFFIYYTNSGVFTEIIIIIIVPKFGLND